MGLCCTSNTNDDGTRIVQGRALRQLKGEMGKKKESESDKIYFLNRN
jgi:hypothetical protein